MKKNISLLLIFFFSIATVHAAYLKDIPTTVMQPNGNTLHCYASGDEFFNYLHDENGFTIIQNDKGYYMYAIYDENNNIVPSQFVAGSIDPSANGLQPHVIISNKEYQSRRAAFFDFEDIPHAKTPGRNHGTLNNLVVFIRFSDEDDITTPFSKVDNMFNNQTQGFNSMINYFETTSYGQLTIPSTFYPEPDENLILSYQDDNPRSYYMPYNATTNPNGYNGDNQRTQREHTLLRKAIEHIADMVPEDLDIDYNSDGRVDNVCFVVKGNTTAWATLLWPHRWSLYSQAAYIHGKRVWDYNFMLEGAGNFNTAVLCHEMQHTLSFPDFYHYNYSGSPCGAWDIMESNPNPPQQSGAYAKWKYGNWLSEPTEIQPGEEYTLNSVGNGTGIVSLKIPTDDPRQFFILEYRNSGDPFENFGSYGNVNGVLIYRIDTRWNGNAGYNPNENTFDEVFIFRPGGGNYPANNGTLSQAHFGPGGRTKFDASTGAQPTLTDGTVVTNFSIAGIKVNDGKASFTYRTTQFYEVTYNSNGGTGTMLPQMFEIDVAQNLRKNNFRFGTKVFLGWALTPDGEIEYEDNQSITVSEKITLYAVWSSLGMNENKKANVLFSIQPNPATQYFEITFSPSELNYNGITAQIYDVQGLLLRTEQLYNEKTQIDISNLAKGFYIVKIGKEAKKLIVK